DAVARRIRTAAENVTWERLQNTGLFKAVSDKMGVACGIGHVPDTRPATAIVETADQLGCSLIVMSSHGRRGISRLLLGSQTTEVLATAKVPVLVVR
ncbi:universal stress protein, partial [Mesorhizobium sp. A623]